jgi:hypothetical protein
MILRFGYLPRSAFFIVNLVYVFEFYGLPRSCSSLMELAKSMTMEEDLPNIEMNIENMEFLLYC